MKKVIWSHTKRVFIGIFGGMITLIGVVLIPYPGPGWLIVFSGLAILSTEFDFARRLLDYAKSRYERFQRWLRHQPFITRLGVLLCTIVIIVVTLWLLDAYGTLNRWLDLGFNWVESPLRR